MRRALPMLSLLMIAFFSWAESTPDQPLISNSEPVICSTPVATAQPPIGNQAIEFFGSLLHTNDWPARWHCGNWSDFHGWLYIISDVVIWLSYFMIPLTLGYFVYRKKDEKLPFRSIVLLFIFFILGCGLTHFIDAVIFWWPAYRLSALIRFLTATVSFATVFALVRIAPRVIELKSPDTLEKMVEQRTLELQALNITLQAEIRQREKAEAKLRLLNMNLEERSAALQETNKQLLAREMDLRKNEERVKQLNTNLEQTIEERTQQLNESNRELEAFTYSVSHDLRAPLRAIDGYAKILEEDYNERLDAQGRRLIQVITKNARYMGQLIDDLLEFSRASRSEVVKTQFRTEDEVKAICADLMTHEKNRNLEIEIKSLLPCKGDITMLRQVWINLMANAVKYTRKREVAHIEVGCNDLGDEVEYYVKDNGVGFDMDYVDKLFGVFQRLHRKEEFEGTGVGLALVKRIVDRNGGKIWAQAVVNQGATFFLQLPK
jgi:signal transduction histidine kinase